MNKTERKESCEGFRNEKRQHQSWRLEFINNYSYRLAIHADVFL